VNGYPFTIPVVGTSGLCLAITVLVVDNEPGFASLAGEMLERERESIAAEAATDGAEALAILERRGVDCIVSDYEMPEMTGLELLERVREGAPTCRLSSLQGGDRRKSPARRSQRG